MPPTEFSPEMEAALGVESLPELMSVAARWEKLLERLNLDGLVHWSPENAVVVRELVLAYHDVFALESNELGCTSAIEHEICIENSEPIRELFWNIPPPLLEMVCALLRYMLEAGAICLSQSPWCNAVVLVWKKTVLCTFVSISGTLTHVSHPLFLRVKMTHTNDKAVIYNYILYYIQENYTL